MLYVPEFIYKLQILTSNKCYAIELECKLAQYSYFQIELIDIIFQYVK